jgi:cellulose synthase (UDP-forming)
MSRKTQPLTRVSAALFLGVLAVLAISLAYLAVRVALFLETDYTWFERAVAFALLASEAFILVHGVGYFLNILHALRSPQRPEEPGHLPELDAYPPIAVIVSSYREPLEVVEANLICFHNLTYPNKNIYFLDDTRYDLPAMQTEEMRAYRREIDRLCRQVGVNLFRRKWHGAKAGMINDFLDFRAGRPRPDFEFSHFQQGPIPEPEDYVIVFDADMNPLPDFAEELVKRLEENPKLAFIQTPQYYTNFETNRVARAAGLQQAIFYEYICEGKGSQDAMFCCGTNVIFRRAALEDVGGFDETSVTEDFATSSSSTSRAGVRPT